MTVEQGRKLPPAIFKQMTSDGIKDIELRELVAGKKVTIFGLPGAYTPVCSTSHLPGYVAEAEKLKAEGTAEIACISVNDAFLMGAWGEQHGAEGKVLMLCDTDASFTNRIGMDLDLASFAHQRRTGPSPLASSELVHRAQLHRPWPGREPSGGRSETADGTFLTAPSVKQHL